MHSWGDDKYKTSIFFIVLDIKKLKGSDRFFRKDSFSDDLLASASRSSWRKLIVRVVIFLMKEIDGDALFKTKISVFKTIDAGFPFYWIIFTF